MSPPLRIFSSRRPSRGGFALVIALSLMAFVLLLLLSITTLVRVESQGASISIEKLRAEQNALLGLNLALGELQKHAGRDQTITARADLITDASGTSTAVDETRYYTGVWDTQTETFSKWLASAADNSGQLDPTGLTSEGDVNAAPSAPGTIALKTLSTLDPDSGSVESVNVVVDQVSVGTDGNYAYWVADEGIKAKVDLVADEQYYQALAAADAADPALRTPLGAAPGIGFELLQNLPAALVGIDKHTDANLRAQLRKLFSPQDYTHLSATDTELSLLHPDVTTYSYGLLTNPKSGGLKEDLSLAFEHGSKDSGNVFVEENYAHPDGVMDVRGPTWSVFQDHYNLYKQMDFTGGIPQLETTDPRAHGSLSGVPQGDFYVFRDAYQLPLIDPVAYETAATQTGTGPSSNFVIPRANAVQVSPVFLGNFVIVSLVIDSATNKLVPILQPVALLWNPYNVALKTASDITVISNMNCGLEFRFQNPASPDADSSGYVYKGRGVVNWIWNASIPSGLQRAQDIGMRPVYLGEVRLVVNSGQSFAPGEIKLYTTNGRETLIEPSVSDQFSVGGGYYLTGWRALSGAGWSPAQPGLGSASYENYANKTGKIFNYSLDGTGMLVEPSVTAIDMALTPMGLQDVISGLYLSSGNRALGPYYQKRTLLPLDMNAGDYSGEPMGSFSAIGQDDGVFFRLNLSITDLATPYPVGIFMNSIVSGDDINNTLNASSPMELHLSSNPRAPFVSNTVGTYAHFKVNPSVIFDSYRIGGASALEDLFFDGKYAYYGMSYYGGNGGQSRPVAWEFPVSPLTSLAQLQHVFFNRDSYEPSYAVGNSFASPYLRREESISTVGHLNLRRLDGTNPVAAAAYAPSYANWTGTAIDYSYKLNEALWDDYFFSSLAPIYENGSVQQDLNATIDAFTNGTQILPNPRLQLYLGQGDDVAVLANGWKSSDPDLSSKKVAANLLVEGAFNVNSTSVEAWKAFLGSLYQQEVAGMELSDSASGGGENLEMQPNPSAAVFSRFSLPTLDRSHPSDNTDIQNNQGSGYRVLDADELEALAVAVVEQVKQRGPFLSLADFVNRELSNGVEGLMGPLQQAINDAGLNDDYQQGLTVDKGGSVVSPNQHDIFLDPEAGTGNSYGAGPGYLLQGDILNSLGPFLTVKSNTFVIRTCGESSDPITGQTSQVFLEAVVQQVPDFVDDSNPANTAIDALNATNTQFGRQFKVVHLRRLNPDQI